MLFIEKILQLKISFFSCILYQAGPHNVGVVSNKSLCESSKLSIFSVGFEPIYAKNMTQILIYLLISLRIQNKFA